MPYSWVCIIDTRGAALSVSWLECNINVWVKMLIGVLVILGWLRSPWPRDWGAPSVVEESGAGWSWRTAGGTTRADEVGRGRMAVAPSWGGVWAAGLCCGRAPGLPGGRPIGLVRGGAARLVAGEVPGSAGVWAPGRAGRGPLDRADEAPGRAGGGASGRAGRGALDRADDDAPGQAGGGTPGRAGRGALDRADDEAPGRAGGGAGNPADRDEPGRSGGGALGLAGRGPPGRAGRWASGRAGEGVPGLCGGLPDLGGAVGPGCCALSVLLGCAGGAWGRVVVPDMLLLSQMKSEVSWVWRFRG